MFSSLNSIAVEYRLKVMGAYVCFITDCSEFAFLVGPRECPFRTWKRLFLRYARRDHVWCYLKLQVRFTTLSTGSS